MNVKSLQRWLEVASSLLLININAIYETQYKVTNIRKQDMNDLGEIFLTFFSSDGLESVTIVT